MLAGSASRRWGDGKTDTREHVIEDISYSGAYVLCRCGVVLIDGFILIGEGDERRRVKVRVADGTAWIAHSGKQAQSTGDRTRINEPAPAHERFEAILTEFARLRGRCTCTPGSDITLCPNYQPGDEEVDDE